jgi:hypothetical protein
VRTKPVVGRVFTLLLARHARAAARPAARGFVPLPGTVGYGATVWDLLPTYPPRITEHGAPGGPTYAPRITEQDAGNQQNYSGNQVK